MQKAEFRAGRKLKTKTAKKKGGVMQRDLRMSLQCRQGNMLLRLVAQLLNLACLAQCQLAIRWQPTANGLELLVLHLQLALHYKAHVLIVERWVTLRSFASYYSHRLEDKRSSCY